MLSSVGKKHEVLYRFIENAIWDIASFYGRIENVFGNFNVETSGSG